MYKYIKYLDCVKKSLPNLQKIIKIFKKAFESLYILAHTYFQYLYLIIILNRLKKGLPNFGKLLEKT